MQKFSDTIATTKPDGTIEVLPSATVTVYLAGTTTPASIYSTNTGTAKANPFLSAASTGRIEFYAADGRYDLRVDKAGYATVSVLDVLLEDPDNIDDNLDGVTISNSTLSACILLNSTVNDVDSVSFSDTPDALTPRRMAWNADEGTLDVALDNSTTLQLGLELHYRARNATAATIADGAVVWATGTTGASGRISVGLAVADGSQPGKTVMGLMTHATAAGTDGYVANFGKVRNINTTGAAVGETWLNGDILYLHPTIPGALTKVKPAVNGHIVVTVAIVIYAGNNGTLFVRPTADSQEADEIRYTPAGTGAVATTVQSKLRESVSVFDFMTAAQIADVQAGTASVDVTAAIQAAHAASKQVHYPRGKYRINWTESTALVTYSSATQISITGDEAVLYDTRIYAADSVSAVFQFTSCTGVVVNGLNYEGQPIVNKSNATTGIGYRGATFVNLSSNCTNITVNADLKYLRYGIRAGDYSDPTKGENNNIRANLTTLECGYPVAFYLTTGVDLYLHSEGSHRTAYLAGVRGGRVRAYFKNQYIAPIQVLVTDATTNGQDYPTGTSRGCSNLDIKAYDLGSTIWIDNSFCAAISMSRGDAGTVFENLNFDVYVKASDTVASKLSGFGLYNSFTSIQPSYPNNWEQTFFFRNIKVTGTIDRSDQTIAENSGNGELYIYAFTSGTNYGTLQGVDLSGFRYYPGSGAKTRGFYYVAPGLVGTSKIDTCDFGTATPFTLITNSTSLVSFNATRLRGSYLGTSDSPYNSAAAFIDCTIADPAYQPLTNKTFFNTTIRGSRTAVVTKIIDTALSGASVTLSSAIPAGCVVVGVSGIVTTAITGATGFEVGISGDTTRYGNMFAVAQGTTIAAVTNSSATGPINYPSFTNLVVTAKTSNFTGGALRLAIHYINFTNLTL